MGRMFRNGKYRDLDKSHCFDVLLAMTEEDLHGKGEIATEICIRDQHIKELEERIAKHNKIMRIIGKVNPRQTELAYLIEI